MQASESLEYDARCLAAYERARERVGALRAERDQLKRDSEHMTYAVARRRAIADRLEAATMATADVHDERLWKHAPDDDAFAYGAHARETPGSVALQCLKDAYGRERKMENDLLAAIDAHERGLRVVECKLALADAQLRTLCKFYTFASSKRDEEDTDDGEDGTAVAYAAVEAAIGDAAPEEASLELICPFAKDVRVRHGTTDRKGVVMEGPDRVHGQMCVSFDGDWKTETVHACDCFPLPAAKGEPTYVWQGKQRGMYGLALAVDKDHVFVSACTDAATSGDVMQTLYRMDAHDCVLLASTEPLGA